MKITVAKSPNSDIQAAVESVKLLLVGGKVPSNKQLIEICADYHIGLVDTIGSEPHFVHEILEAAVNLYISETESLKSFTVNQQKTTLERLEKLTNQLPPQSWRGEDQVKLQQFSTPPALAFVLASLLNPFAGRIALEPSAGTGSLAVWLNCAGCLTEVNEISERRKLLLELQGFKPFKVNAEFLNDLLPAQIKPDYILMNPPFSSSGGRTKTHDSKFGFRHLETALLRLIPGGKLVALLGADACLNTEKGKTFWHRIGTEYDVRAFLIVPRDAFYKYGTTFQTVAVIIHKPENNERPILAKPKTVDFGNLSEMLSFNHSFDLINLRNLPN